MKGRGQAWPHTLLQPHPVPHWLMPAPYHPSSPIGWSQEEDLPLATPYTPPCSLAAPCAPPPTPHWQLHGRHPLGCFLCLLLPIGCPIHPSSPLAAPLAHNTPLATTHRSPLATSYAPFSLLAAPYVPQPPIGHHPPTAAPHWPPPPTQSTPLATPGPARSPPSSPRLQGKGGSRSPAKAPSTDWHQPSSTGQRWLTAPAGPTPASPAVPPPRVPRPAPPRHQGRPTPLPGVPGVPGQGGDGGEIGGEGVSCGAGGWGRAGQIAPPPQQGRGRAGPYSPRRGWRPPATPGRSGSPHPP